MEVWCIPSATHLPFTLHSQNKVLSIKVSCHHTFRYLLVRDASQNFIDWGNISVLGLPQSQISTVSFKVVPCEVYTPGPVPLPLLEASPGNSISWCSPAPPVIQLESPQCPGIFVHLTGFSSFGTGMCQKGSFCPLWPYTVGFCTHQVSYISGHHSADGAQIMKHPASSLCLWLKCTHL